jgi:hypothetical protein
MHRTTTATAATALLAAGILLTGCTSSGDSDAKATAPPSSSAAAVPTVPVRDQFLQGINAANIQSWEHAGPTDDELAAYPDQWCAALAEGHSVDWMFGQGGQYPIGMSWGTRKADAYKVLVLAVGYYCPARKGDVEEQLRATGDY